MSDYRDSIEKEYARGKAKFYANPVFAGLVGLAIGFVAGAVLF